MRNIQSTFNTYRLMRQWLDRSLEEDNFVQAAIIREKVGRVKRAILKVAEETEL